MTITQLESTVLQAFIATSMDCCGDFSSESNLSYCNDQDIAEHTGLSRHQVAALFGSLDKKGLIVDTRESARRAKCNDYIACPENCRDVPEIRDYINSYVG